jgi:hypothetical protein
MQTKICYCMLVTTLSLAFCGTLQMKAIINNINQDCFSPPFLVPFLIILQRHTQSHLNIGHRQPSTAVSALSRVTTSAPAVTPPYIHRCP